MLRKAISINGVRISYLDNEKSGKPLICLHGHYGTGSMFKFLDNHYNGRLVLPDQRGHGLSDHVRSYARKDYIGDLKSLIDMLGIERPILLGHSLGGVNAFQYCAEYKNVSKLIIEDIGTEIPQQDNFFVTFPKEFDSIWDVNNEFMKQKRPLSTYFMESLYYDDTRWKFRFDYDEIAESLNCLSGNYWTDWESIDCPILLLHGMKSWACKTENLIEMEKRNKNSRLICYENASHSIHDDVRDDFVRDLMEFIEG